ncbi:putative carboxylesterase 18 [Iris pallida]|uniref:Carboxylesterase 18 n=1 Tax=Iris pallida TaxID=29817 RepID=A0AAX6ESK1_IRIPA|nr:putative carboxylesterase 18 [Iris pallida]
MGMGVDEVLHLLQEYPSLLGVREYVEGVGGLSVLHQPHLLPPPPQPLRVPPLPVLERVPPSHHHHRRRVPLLQLLRVVRPEHVAGLVVPVGPLRQEGSPQPIRPRDRHERRLRQPQLRLRPLLPAEVGLYHHQARQLQALPPAGAGPAARDVVDYVPARAVAHQEGAGEVGERDVGAAAAVLVEEAEDVEAVGVGRGALVLRREAVVHGGDDGGELAREPAADGVVGPRGGGEEREAAPVEEYDHREGRAVGGGCARDEEAEPEAA